MPERGCNAVFEDKMAEANRVIGAVQTGKCFKKSVELAYKWANSNRRSIDQSANTNPIELMCGFLERLADNGGLRLAIEIERIFISALIKERQ